MQNINFSCLLEEFLEFIIFTKKKFLGIKCKKSRNIEKNRPRMPQIFFGCIAKLFVASSSASRRFNLYEKCINIILMVACNLIF